MDLVENLVDGVFFWGGGKPGWIDIPSSVFLFFFFLFSLLSLLIG